MNVIPIPCAFDNYAYLLICAETGLAAVIDPTEAYPVWKEVEAAEALLVSVLCTHHHRDHVGGVTDLLEEQPELKVYGFSGDVGRIPGLNIPLADGDPVVIGSMTGKVMHTPGHTRGSVCYLFDDVLFTGDTVFGGGCGRLFEGTPEQMYDSLKSKISRLPEATRIYFGHEYTEKNLQFAGKLEPANKAIARRAKKVQEKRNNDIPSSPSTLQEEMETNPFFRCHSNAIRANFLTVDPHAADSVIFALIRKMRDTF